MLLAPAPHDAHDVTNVRTRAPGSCVILHCSHPVLALALRIRARSPFVRRSQCRHPRARVVVSPPLLSRLSSISVTTRHASLSASPPSRSCCLSVVVAFHYPHRLPTSSSPTHETSTHTYGYPHYLTCSPPSVVVGSTVNASSFAFAPLCLCLPLPPDPHRPIIPTFSNTQPLNLNHVDDPFYDRKALCGRGLVALPRTLHARRADDVHSTFERPRLGTLVRAHTAHAGVLKCNIMFVAAKRPHVCSSQASSLCVPPTGLHAQTSIRRRP